MNTYTSACNFSIKIMTMVCGLLSQDFSIKGQD